jgi:hypothetical protein
MTDAAIARVEAIVLHQHQPLLQASGLVVEWRPDQQIDDSEYDFDYVPPPAVPRDVFDHADYDALAADEVADLLADGPHPFYDPHAAQGAIPNDDDDDADDNDSVVDDHNDYYGNDDDDDDDDQGTQEGTPKNNFGDYDDFDDDDAGFGDDDGAGFDDEAAANQGAPDEAADRGAPNEAHQGAPDEVADQGAPNEAAEQAALDEAAPHYNLRPRNNTASAFQAAIDATHDGKSYFPPRQLLQRGFTLTQCGTERFSLTAPSDFDKSVFGYIMHQMTAQAGIKKHGRAAEAALMNEFAQLEKLDVYESVDPSTLTHEQRKGAIRAINLLKEKRDGTLKGRTVADGRPQRSLYDKSETTPNP